MDEKSFSKAFDERTVLLDLPCTSRDEVLVRMIDVAIAAGRIAPARKEAVHEAVLAREGLGSTGIGGGIAIPHAKTDAVDAMVTAVAVTRRPIDFKAVDGEPCDIFFLLIAPKSQHETHLAMLRWLSRHKRNADFTRFLRNAREPGEVISVLEESNG